MKKDGKKEKTELEVLQERRDFAKSDEERKKAQGNVDRYFMQDPLKSKKSKKKRRRPSPDEFGFDSEFMDDERNFVS